MTISTTTLTLELQTSSDDDRPVFIAGNFNDWQAEDAHFRMEQTAAGHFRFRFPAKMELPNPLEYKYLRGNWQEEEAGPFGESVENRILFRYSGIVKDQVPTWKRNGIAYKKEFLPHIEVLAEDFEIPQLIKTRRIAALLPHDYHSKNQHYPVLYLQDGQNLFDDYAPYGSWGVDKKLAMLTEKGMGNLIVVAIDHAEKERIKEFTPSYQTHLGRGEGKKYTRFLADTLKPFIDKRFRTLHGREHTGIGGSSMGALISIYAGMMYPEVYGRLMLFSPSLWVAPRVPLHTIAFTEPMDARIYVYAGGKESKNMIPNVKRFQAEIERNAADVHMDFKLSIDPEGQHNEARWGEEFPKAVEWLFFSENKVNTIN